MKKRGRIFLLGILLITLIITSLTMLAKIQLEQFNRVYIEEEKEEIAALAKQVSWAVKPILASKNYKELKEYCELFKGTDSEVTIKDEKGNLIIGNKNVFYSYQEETFIESPFVYHSIPLKIGNETYTLIISTATNHIAATLTKYEKYILLSIIIGCFIIVILGLYLFETYKSFNNLQNSAVKISEGDMNTNIFIPKGGILYELACALDKMSKRLKFQINEMQKLEDFRSEFIANVSHEVKTPLTAILSAVETLEDSGQNQSERKCLSILKKQSERLNSLVQDILSLSEIERRHVSDKKDFNIFNLSCAVNNSVSLCSVSNIKINMSLEDIEIYGDSSLIEQALINLITNAIKYSKSDTIDISVRKKEGNALISIKDYGVGIPQEHLPRLFEHFYRVDKARSRDLGGTGLGLSIVKNIVKLHNGKIEVISDSGCNFIITLPLLT